MSRVAVCFVLSACFATAGCDESLQPIAGPSPNLTPTFSSIQREIFESSDEAGRAACVTCHRPGGIGFLAVGMDLTTSAAYNSLVGVSSRQRPGVVRVAPGDPDNSYLIHKLEKRAGMVGLQMPLNGPPYLTAGQIRIIERWIETGAENN
jgi:hypothetical protein